jgi:CRP-like cAMP-binding protein
MLGIGDYFGEMALLDGEPRSAAVTAAGELQTMRLPRNAFLQQLEKEPRIAVPMMAELSSRIRRLEKPQTI